YEALGEAWSAFKAAFSSNTVAIAELAQQTSSIQGMAYNAMSKFAKLENWMKSKPLGGERSDISPTPFRTAVPVMFEDFKGSGLIDGVEVGFIRGKSWGYAHLYHVDHGQGIDIGSPVTGVFVVGISGGMWKGGWFYFGDPH